MSVSEVRSHAGASEGSPFEDMLKLNFLLSPKGKAPMGKKLWFETPRLPQVALSLNWLGGEGRSSSFVFLQRDPGFS